MAKKDLKVDYKSPTFGTAQNYAVEWIPPSDLKPDPNNPRKHSRSQLRAIRKSYRQFGFNAPMLVDANNQIIAGHGRHAAALLENLPQVPVVRLEHLSPSQARQYMLADNKLSDRSSFDDKLLALNLKQILIDEPTIDFGVMGFQAPEADLLIQSINEADQPDPDDDYTPAAGVPVSRLGDLWHLNNHRIVCGDAQVNDFYCTALGTEKASATITDPPYNLPINGHVSSRGRRRRHREFAMASGEMSPQKFSEFQSNTARLIQTYSLPGAIAFVFIDWRHLEELGSAFRSAGFELLNLCVWVKNNGGLGSLYRSRHELVPVFRNGGGQHTNNVQLGRFGRNRTNVWHCAGASGFPRSGGVNPLDLHPTAKPVSLIADAILDVTNRGEIVLDPYLGAGSALLAAERTGRRCCGIEIDPLYVDTSILRWERMTKCQAVHASGKTFAEIKAERGVP